MRTRRTGHAYGSQSASHGKRTAYRHGSRAVHGCWLRFSAAARWQWAVRKRNVDTCFRLYPRALERPAAGHLEQSSFVHAYRNTINHQRYPDQGDSDLATNDSSHEINLKATTMNIDFPFHFDARGRTAATDDSDHIRDMIEQLLFTNPGERVNLPDFGSGLLQMVFAPNSPELAAALQFTMQAALQRYLGDVIDLQTLEVTSQDSSLNIVVKYVIKSTGDSQTQNFVRSAPSS